MLQNTSGELLWVNGAFPLFGRGFYIKADIAFPNKKKKLLVLVGRRPRLPNQSFWSDPIVFRFLQGKKEGMAVTVPLWMYHNGVAKKKWKWGCLFSPWIYQKGKMFVRWIPQGLLKTLIRVSRRFRNHCDLRGCGVCIGLISAGRCALSGQGFGVVAEWIGLINLNWEEGRGAEANVIQEKKIWGNPTIS